MKKFLLGLAMMLMAGVGSLHAFVSFEGEVDYKITTGDKSGDMNYLLKGKKMRMDMDMEGHSQSMIFDMPTRKMLMLMPEQKMYMTMDIPENKQEAAKAKSEGKFTKTGKTETILGYKCEEWLYESKHGTTSIWAASGLGNFMGMGQKSGMGASAWTQMVKSKGLFPLRVTSKGANGKGEMSMEATKVEKRSLSDSLFEVPAGFKKMESPNMGAMGGASGKKMSKEDIMKMMEQYKK